MRRPRLLDLYCCEGGAGMGYALAGFDVHGVDITPRFARRYPFTFTAADALDYVTEHAHRFDAIHASPPCQRYSITNAARRHDYPDLVGSTREALADTGLPYVIENVPRSPLLEPTVLCGTQFDLTTTDDDGTLLHLQRHRLFESNVTLAPPKPCHHPAGVQWAGSYGGARRDKIEARTVRRGGYVPAKHVQQRLLGIDWMTQHGLHQSLPPVYTRHIGGQLMGAIR